MAKGILLLDTPGTSVLHLLAFSRFTLPLTGRRQLGTALAAHLAVRGINSLGEACSAVQLSSTILDDRINQFASGIALSMAERVIAAGTERGSST